MESTATPQEDLAWAAGLLDGDGTFSTAVGHAMTSVGNTDRELLERFRIAVGCGNICGPYTRERPGAWNKKAIYFLQAYRDTYDIARMLWPYLGKAKRARVRRLELATTWRGPSPQAWEIPQVSTRRILLAWAAGFFDAEGCFSFSQQTGPSATITNTDRDQLGRFQRAVGVGKIYGPYRFKASDAFHRKPQYSFRATGLEKTQAIAAMLWFELGTAKKRQASAALSSVSTTCRRGHPKMRGHAGCGHCTKDYWQARRDAKRNSTAEPSTEYLIA